MAGVWSSPMRELPACNEIHFGLEKINYSGLNAFSNLLFSAAAGSRCAAYAASKHALQVLFNKCILNLEHQDSYRSSRNHKTVEILRTLHPLCHVITSIYSNGLNSIK